MVCALGKEYENELVKKSQNGCSTSMNKLIDQYRVMLSKMAHKYTIPGLSHDDVVQEFIIFFIDAIKSFDFGRNVKFITHVTNTIRYGYMGMLKSLNTDKRKIVYDQLISFGDPAYTSYLSALESNLTGAQFEDVVSAESFSYLNGKEREIVKLMFFESVSTKEICAILKISTNRLGVIKQNIKEKTKRHYQSQTM